jgi:hypothetical protein
MAERREPLQDGMLIHWLANAKTADANVERRIEREAFAMEDHIRPKPRSKKPVTDNAKKG